MGVRQRNVPVYSEYCSVPPICNNLYKPQQLVDSPSQFNAKIIQSIPINVKLLRQFDIYRYRLRI